MKFAGAAWQGAIEFDGAGIVRAKGRVRLRLREWDVGGSRALCKYKARRAKRDA